ncbi:hypothetical protein H6G33_24805 [Calothrix sp. FACHB-1219]|uniref:hypothetical protein n=1 Tax=unclassified Calothrix TaxID=2619626 RepID=UPI001689259A|nr:MULTISPECIES: hypothetical protein [unclassified Calothrix]MBD2205566.1 hypothetical protein [Calothrix sp. FACHB-168]MBD2220229.1 hypothetical protein [Calothrix sp. FACHB-1219]
MPAELYKNGIIEISENLDFTEEEELWDVFVHFQGYIFSPVVAGASQNRAFEIGRDLYDWIEENYCQEMGDRFTWKRYSVNREDPRH